GYFYMPYSYLTDDNLANDFWTIRAVSDGGATGATAATGATGASGASGTPAAAPARRRRARK
ncbi:MAG TPA: hypothetical protein VF832_10810, partial [Longimicrobiales bacterium]